MAFDPRPVLFLVLWASLWSSLAWIQGHRAYDIVRGGKVKWSGAPSMFSVTVGGGGSVNENLRRLQYGKVLEFHQRSARRGLLWLSGSLFAGAVHTILLKMSLEAALFFGGLIAMMILGMGWLTSWMVAKGIQRAGGLPAKPGRQ